MTPSPSQMPADSPLGYLDQPQAWSQLSRGLQRIAFAIVGNEGDAEDVVQAAWIEFLKNPRREISPGWLKRLVRFRALDVLRARSREPIALGDGASELSSVANSEDNSKLDAQRKVLAAVNSLKEPYLSTVILRYFEGKGPREIAAQLNVPERTVKTRLTRAHESLRDKLRAGGDESAGKWTPGLVAFSGFEGLGHAPLNLPVAGALFMKKAILVAAAIALALLVPLAIQNRGADSVPLTKTAAETASMPGLSPAPFAAGVEPTSRELVQTTEESPEESQRQDEFEFAFPRKLESEVGTLAIQIRQTDGSPGSHIRLGIMPEAAQDAFLMSRNAFTDSAGFVEVDQLAPGPVTIRSSSTQETEVEILAGQRTQVELEAQAGMTIQGRVLTQTGTPVAGALVYRTSGPSSDAQSRATTISDAQGRYELPHTRTHSYISARSVGYSPSFQVRVTGEPGHTVPLDIVLRDGAGTLRGIALSPLGLPVVGARVRIDINAPWEEQPIVSNAEVSVRGPLSIELRTDENGRFESDQLGASEIRVQARTKTWRPWEELLLVDESAPTEVTIQFEEGATLSGKVLLANGEPAENTTVFTGEYAQFESFRAKTDAQGIYKFEGLPPGFSEVNAYLKGHNQETAEIQIRPGQAHELDFELGGLLSVKGVVVDESGAPLSRWLVAVDTSVGHWITSAWTDDAGAFDLVGIPHGTTDLFVCTEHFMQAASGVNFESILPSQGPLRIVVPNSARPESSVQVDLELNGKPAPVLTRVRLHSASPFIHREVYPDLAGRVVMANLASGSFRLEVFLEGYAPVTREFELAHGEELDLGTLFIERGGRAQVEIDAGDAGSEFRVDALDMHGRVYQSIAIQGGSGISQPLPAGVVTLRSQAPGYATQFAAVEIEADEVTRVRFIPRPGVERTAFLARKNGKSLRYATRVSVLDSQGNVVFFTGDVQRLERPDATAVIELGGLEVGAYQVQVDEQNGGSAGFWIHVSALTPTRQSLDRFHLDW